MCKVAFCVACRLHILRGNFPSLMANSDEVITQSVMKAIEMPVM